MVFVCFDPCQQAHKIGPVKRHSGHRTSETSFGSEWRDSGPILGAGSAYMTVPVIKHFFSHVETWLNWFQAADNMSCPRTQHSASAGVESRTSNLKVPLTLQHLQNVIQYSVACRYNLQKYCTQDRQSVDPNQRKMEERIT